MLDLYLGKTEETKLTLLFIFAISIYFIVLMKFTNSIYYYKDIDINEGYNPNISIIISARNEEKNIKKTLDSLIEQNYPNDKYEILVANDRSTDNTQSILYYYKKKYKNIKILNIDKTPIGWSNKKWALNELINISNSDIILQIDADCIAPISWIKTMSAHFIDDKVGFVCGSSPLIHNDPILNKIFQMESLIQESINAGSILNNMTVSCTGRNIAFRKKYFKQVDGYSGNEAVPSGDDALILQKISIQNNCKIKYSINSNSLVNSFAPKNFSEFIRQRLRFSSKAILYYKLNTTIELKAISILIYLSNVVFLSSVILVINFNLYFLLIPILMKIFSDFMISITFLLKVKRDWSLKTFLILTIIHPFYIVLFGFLGPLVQVDWKK